TAPATYHLALVLLPRVDHPGIRVPAVRTAHRPSPPTSSSDRTGSAWLAVRSPCANHVWQLSVPPADRSRSNSACRQPGDSRWTVGPMLLTRCGRVKPYLWTKYMLVTTTCRGER